MTSKIKNKIWKPNRHRFQALPILLLRAREASIKNVRPVFRKFDMTEQRWRILRSLYDTEVLSASELAQQVFLSMTSISRITKQLSEEKLVTRKIDPLDKRSILFSITQKGRILCSRIGPALEAKHAETFNDLDKIDMDKLEKTINTLIGELGGLTIPGN